MGVSWGGEWHGTMPLACPWLPVVQWADCFKKCSELYPSPNFGLGDVGVDRLGCRVCCGTAASGAQFLLGARKRTFYVGSPRNTLRRHLGGIYVAYVNHLGAPK